MFFQQIKFSDLMIYLIFHLKTVIFISFKLRIKNRHNMFLSNMFFLFYLFFLVSFFRITHQNIFTRFFNQYAITKIFIIVSSDNFFFSQYFRCRSEESNDRMITSYFFLQFWIIFSFCFV